MSYSEEGSVFRGLNGLKWSKLHSMLMAWKRFKTMFLCFSIFSSPSPDWLTHGLLFLELLSQLKRQVNVIFFFLGLILLIWHSQEIDTGSKNKTYTESMYRL